MKSAQTKALDIYHKKTVELTLAGASLTFAVSQTLFSSHQIDIGSLHLLKTLTDISANRILDLGCGYGPIGLALGRLNPAARLQLVDRDALAIDFCRHNAALNQISHLQVYGSLGYDSVSARDFDLIVSNIPGKAGDSVIRALLHGARQHLAEGGRVAVVVVAPLEAMVREALAKPGIETVYQESTSAHAIFHYCFTDPSPDSAVPTALEEGAYHREKLTFVLDDLELPMRTAQGLPEFDTLSHVTELLIKSLRELEGEAFERVTVFNPGQGHVSMVVRRLLAPKSLDLADRDLLSLRYSALNLAEDGAVPNAVHSHHQVALLPPTTAPDLLVGRLREDEGPEAMAYGLAQAASRMRTGSRILVAGGSTPVTRLMKSRQVGRHARVVKRKRRKGGISTLLLERR